MTPDDDAHRPALLKGYFDFGRRLLRARTISQAIEITGHFIVEITHAQAAFVRLIGDGWKEGGAYGFNRENQAIGEKAFEPLLGVLRQVKESGVSVVLSGEEITAETGFTFEKGGTRWVVGLPLIRDGETTVGVIIALFDQEQPIPETEMHGLEYVSALLAGFLGHLRLLTDYRQREADLAMALETAHMMISTLDLEELLRQIAIRLAWAMGMEACAISILDHDPERVRTLAQYTAFGDEMLIDIGHEYLLDNYPATARVLETNEPLFVQLGDPQADPSELALIQREGYTTEYLFPLWAVGRPVGLVELYSSQVTVKFDSSSLRRMQTLAEPVALALVNARLYADEQRARLMADTLRQATAAINSTLDLSQVLNLILQQFQKVVAYDSASLMLVGENGEISIASVRGHPQPEEALKVRFQVNDDYLASEVVSKKRPMILADAWHDNRFAQRGNAHYVRGWMGVPLMVRGEVVGLLTIDSRQPDAYGDEDAQLAMAFAANAAMAVMNARLFQSEQMQRALSDALREISLAVSGSLKETEILEILLEQVEKVVPYDSGCVMMVNGDTVRVGCQCGYDKFGVADDVASFEYDLEALPNLNQMAVTLRPSFISDVAAYPDWFQSESAKHVGSWVGAPLMVRDSLLGFLSLDKVERGFYTAEYADRLDRLASHAALALWNALTYGEMEKASITDFITGTFNHRFFQQQLRKTIEHAQRMEHPLSLLMIDIDHFKLVNDRYGHQQGDQVLRLLAARLRAELRATDFLARYGGEEFAILLPGITGPTARLVADRLLKSISGQPFQVEGNLIPVTVSIGAASLHELAQDAPGLIASSDQALYRAKSTGRNRVCLDGE